MHIKSFAFNLRELAGSLGDLGTLLPLAIGYIAVCGVNPAGLLVMLGLTNIVTGLVYRLPMPVEPMKVIAVVAIAGHWSPAMVYAAGIGMGIVWTLFALTGVMGLIARITPRSVIRGIQVALGVLLALEAVSLMSGAWVLGGVSLLIILLLRRNRYAPAAVVLVGLGIILMYLRGALGVVAAPGFTLPGPVTFSANDAWQALVQAGLAQIPLTATNAVIATVALIASYWPERRPVTARQLSLTTGLMNLVGPLLGGMPLCHGAGGLAGQYYFGARTGGANIIEGVIEVCLIAALFVAFPRGIIGAMMFMVGVELMKFARDAAPDRSLAPLLVTAAVSIAANMAWGFAAGLAVHYLLRHAPAARCV
jgi:hypothetical protein